MFSGQKHFHLRWLSSVVVQGLDEGSGTSRSPDQQQKQRQCSEVSAHPSAPKKSADGIRALRWPLKLCSTV